MKPVGINLPHTVSGNTFPGRDFTLLFEDAPINITGSKIYLSIRKNSPHAPVIGTLTHADAIEITNGLQGKFRIKPFHADVPPGSYYYDIVFKHPSSVIRTYIAGTWQVLQAITSIPN